MGQSAFELCFLIFLQVNIYGGVSRKRLVNFIFYYDNHRWIVNNLLKDLIEKINKKTFQLAYDNEIQLVTNQRV